MGAPFAYTVICLTDDGNALRLYLKNDRHYILRNFAAAELAWQMHEIGLL